MAWKKSCLVGHRNVAIAVDDKGPTELRERCSEAFMLLGADDIAGDTLTMKDVVELSVGALNRSHTCRNVEREPGSQSRLKTRVPSAEEE